MSLTSPLNRQVVHDPPEGKEADRLNRKAAKQAYHQRGFIMVHPDWIVNWEDRQHAINMADRVHGKRAGDGQEEK